MIVARLLRLVLSAIPAIALGTMLATGCSRFGASVAGPASDAAVDASDDADQIEGLPDATAVACGSPACADGGLCFDGACPEVFAEGSRIAVGVTLSKDFLYYTAEEGALLQKRKSAADRTEGEALGFNAPPSAAWRYLSRSGNRLLWARNAPNPPNTIELDVGGKAELVTSQQSVPSALSVVVANGAVYVSAYDEGLVYELPPDGGKNVAAQWDKSNVEGLATDGNSLYAARNNQGIISRVQPAPTDLVVGGAPAGIDANQDYVYGTDQATGAVFRVPIAGGAREDLARVPGTIPHGVTVDATHVYWTSRNAAPPHQILRVLKPR